MTRTFSSKISYYLFELFVYPIFVTLNTSGLVEHCTKQIGNVNHLRAILRSLPSDGVIVLDEFTALRV